MSGRVDLSLGLLQGLSGPSCLIYGVGNDGRQDDGLGWAFIDWVEAHSLCPEAELHRNYQLQLEDAELISHKQRVLFVDASKDARLDSFELTQPAPKMDFSFTSHAISVPSILATCLQCFGRLPEVHLLAIRGYEWELQMGLTPAARKNLLAAASELSGHRLPALAPAC